MKKSVLYIIIVILLMIIAVGGTYIFMQGQIEERNNPSTSEVDDASTEESTNNIEEPKKDIEVSKPSITHISTKEEGNNIVETFNANLNGKNTLVTVKFEYGTENIDGDFPIEYVEGSINGSRVYYHSVERKEKSQKTTMLNKDYISNKFNKNNFIIIKGTDNKDYLSVVSHTNNMVNSDFGPNDNLYVFDDNMNQIKTEATTAVDCEENAFTVYSRGSGVKVDGNPWYENVFNINLSSQKLPGWDSIRVKIENNKIYYLAQVFIDGDLSNGTLEEREYTINGGKLTYKTIKTYKVLDGAGGIC